MSARPLARTALISLVCSVAASSIAWSQGMPPGPGASAPTPIAHPPMARKDAPRGEHQRRGMKPGLLGPVAAAHIEQLLDDVKATDAQRAQIRVIGDKARADLRALHEKADAEREANRAADKDGPPPGPMGLLTQAKVDASAAEKMRTQMVAFHDATSKRMLQAVVDIANVLTPEQRVSLGAMMKDRMGPRGPEAGPAHGRDGHGEGHGDDHAQGGPDEDQPDQG